MQLNVPPDLETLINKRLSSGGYTNVEQAIYDACAFVAEAPMRGHSRPGLTEVNPYLLRGLFAGLACVGVNIGIAVKTQQKPSLDHLFEFPRYERH